MEYMAGGSVADLVGNFYLLLLYVQCMKIEVDVRFLKDVLKLCSLLEFIFWIKEKYVKTDYKKLRGKEIIL